MYLNIVSCWWLFMEVCNNDFYFFLFPSSCWEVTNMRRGCHLPNSLICISIYRSKKFGRYQKIFSPCSTSWKCIENTIDNIFLNIDPKKIILYLFLNPKLIWQYPKKVMKSYQNSLKNTATPNQIEKSELVTFQTFLFFSLFVPVNFKKPQRISVSSFKKY